MVTSRGLSLPSAIRWRRVFSRASTSSRSAALGFRDVQSRKAWSARAESSVPPSRSTRSAKARAASTKMTSFSPVSAANGVFERIRRAHEKSPLGASKFDITGSGIDRLRNPYTVRRYRSGPVAGVQ